MKIAILAGGKGTRLAEETEVRPKPMVEVGNRPLLWHIMKHYSHYGYDDFAIALGYKGDCIKKYFADYSSLIGNLKVTIGANGNSGVKGIGDGDMDHPNWNIDLIETGADTLTGGRVKRLRNYLGTSTFMLTWGDGISDVNIDKLLAFHRSHGRLATVTAVRPPHAIWAYEVCW